MANKMSDIIKAMFFCLEDDCDKCPYDDNQHMCNVINVELDIEVEE